MRGPTLILIWSLYREIIDTDVRGIFSSTLIDTSFSSRDNKLTTFDTDLWEMVQIQKLQMKNYHAGIILEIKSVMHTAIE